MNPNSPNAYASGPLDRAAHLREDPEWLQQQRSSEQTRWVAVQGSQSLVTPDMLSAVWLNSAAVQAAGEDLQRHAIFLGTRAEQAYFALEVPPEQEGLEGAHAVFADLRQVGPGLPGDEGAILAYARGMVLWSQRTRFCSVCGAPLQTESAGHVKRCPQEACGASHFPRTDPAVIMLVHDGDRVVLGRQPQWPAGMHSILAGFVEPGESLEDTVAREVWEEVGLKVGAPQYHSSQPWPFPASIMLGFTVEATSTELSVHPEELESAQWFTREELRRLPQEGTFRLPRPDSIARRILNEWLAAG